MQKKPIAVRHIPVTRPIPVLRSIGVTLKVNWRHILTYSLYYVTITYY